MPWCPAEGRGGGMKCGENSQSDIFRENSELIILILAEESPWLSV